MDAFFAFLDEPILLALHRLALSCGAFFTPFLRFVSLLAEHGIGPILLSLCLCFFKKTRRAGAGALLSLLLGAVCTNLILKNLIARERPCWLDTQIALLIKSPKDYSFPSGHSMNGFAASIALLCNDKKLGIPAVILASLIAFSRLYHFVHFPTDVMVGILIGTTVAILVHVGYLRWSRRHFS